ncbi:MAG: NAD(P)H-binding protein [Hamadaea sp.]|uniref:NAD(P)H-binding protein n=1 Tax=Hamadaea sp. TaxID=2024425 RepID=UPI0017EAF32E|nr:NAD(P)H-binding protein [Hamadaea sp.]NUR72198.1 NAD(P)H-binding protein [Hamadaea sp.]NUT18615.1 NAD(P)H-binding protein [Hamadaea sp.]
MDILVIGGSGLIGSHIVDVLRERGHAARPVARTPGPDVEHVADLATATVDELRPMLRTCDGVVFAARTDEQKPVKKPLYPVFRRDLVDPVVRLFTAAREEGLTRGAIMGSYYTYFHRMHPEWTLPECHAYVRCRLEQAAEARAAAGPDLPVTVIELPFVFGVGGGRRPNWSGPLDRWARSAWPLLMPDGGTAATTARHVAETTVDALENRAAEDLPIADENLTWRDMLARIAESVGRPRRVRRLPIGLARGAMRLGGALQALGGKETGINLRHLDRLILSELFVEPLSGRPLGDAVAATFPARQP